MRSTRTTPSIRPRCRSSAPTTAPCWRRSTTAHSSRRRRRTPVRWGGVRRAGCRVLLRVMAERIAKVLTDWRRARARHDHPGAWGCGAFGNDPADGRVPLPRCVDGTVSRREQELVDWTQAALATNRRYGWLAAAGFSLGALLLVSFDLDGRRPRHLTAAGDWPTILDWRWSFPHHCSSPHPSTR